MERHRATWDLAGRTAILQGVGEMEAGSEQCKEKDDELEKLLRVTVVCQWIEILVCRFDSTNWKVGRFLSRRTEWVEENGM